MADNFEKGCDEGYHSYTPVNPLKKCYRCKICKFEVNSQEYQEFQDFLSCLPQDNIEPENNGGQSIITNQQILEARANIILASDETDMRLPDDPSSFDNKMEPDAKVKSPPLKQRKTEIDGDIKTEKQILIFGESGTGKSSLINMLLGSKVAEATSSSIGCTFQHKRYSSSDGNFVFYDTIGLGEGSAGKIPAIQAMKQLLSLLQATKNGIHLLIYVIRKGRISESFEKNYKLFYETVCRQKVPILLVITHCEADKDPEHWWKCQEAIFKDKYKMEFVDGLSGCADDGDREDVSPIFKALMKEAYLKTKVRLEGLIVKHSLEKPWAASDWYEWLRTTISSALKIMKIKLSSTEEIGLQTLLYQGPSSSPFMVMGSGHEMVKYNSMP